MKIQVLRLEEKRVWERETEKGWGKSGKNGFLVVNNTTKAKDTKN